MCAYRLCTSHYACTSSWMSKCVHVSRLVTLFVFIFEWVLSGIRKLFGFGELFWMHFCFHFSVSFFDLRRLEILKLRYLIVSNLFKTSLYPFMMLLMKGYYCVEEITFSYLGWILASHVFSVCGKLQQEYGMPNGVNLKMRSNNMSSFYMI